MKPFNRSIICLSVLMSMTILGGCTVSRQDKSAQNPQGTTDGGGGNAIDNRMLESYIIKPEDLPATKLHIAKKIAQLFGDEQDPSGHMIFKIKTWYLIPASLKQANKKALGIEFTEDQTQQVAIQTRDEVWINSNIFNKMSIEEQAKLILHESMMTFYMVKFLSIQEICDKSEKAGHHCEIPSLGTKKFEELYKPEPERPLIAQDYNAIRSITNWVWNANDDLDQSDFYRVSIAEGFDSRFYSRSADKEEQTRLPLKKFQLLLNDARYGNKIAKICTGLESRKSFPCELNWSLVQDESDSATIHVTVQELNTQTIIVDTTGYVYKDASVWYRYFNKIKTATISISSDDLYYLKGGQVSPVGKKGYWVNFIMDGKVSELNGISFTPLINAGTYDEEKEIKKNDGTTEMQICKTVKVTKKKSSNLYDEPFVVGDSTLALDHAVFLNMAEYNGAVSCSPKQLK